MVSARGGNVPRDPRIEPFVEAWNVQPSVPWPHRQWLPEESGFVLSPDLDDETWGLFMAVLLECHSEKNARESPREIVSRAAAGTGLHLYPGLQVVAEDGRLVRSGCCCCLGEWREWGDLLTGGGPFLGHDPDPWLELEGDTVRACVMRDERAGPSPDNLVAIEMSTQHYIECLQDVEHGLVLVLARIERWAADLVGLELAQRFSEQVDRAFSITGDYRTERWSGP